MNRTGIKKINNGGGICDSDYEVGNSNSNGVSNVFDNGLYNTSHHFRTIYNQDFSKHQINQKG